MAKKYGKFPSSNGKTPTPSRRNGKWHDLVRGSSKNSSFKWSPKKK